jgi:hypothetical protein
MRNIRKFPAVDSRVETGAIQFGDDWPGLFLRGDECIQLAIAIDAIWPYIEKAEIGYNTELIFIRSMILRNVLGVSHDNLSSTQAETTKEDKE